MAGAENGVCSEVNSFALKVGCSDDKVVSRYLAFVNVKIRYHSFNDLNVPEGKELTMSYLPGSPSHYRNQ